MFKKFKALVLEALVQNEARFQVEQDKAREKFSTLDDTPEQIAARLKSINDMINPKEFARQVELINSGAVSTAPTYEQIVKQQKEEDAQAVMLKAGKVRREIDLWGEGAQNKAVLGIVVDTMKDTVKRTVAERIQSIRDSAFDNSKKDNTLKPQ